MSNKITDARIEQLKKLMQLKEDLKERINKKTEEMKEIRHAMERGGTTSIILSSTVAALIKRGKKSSNLTNEDVLEIQQVAIDRLEEQSSKAEGELKELKELMESS